MGGLHPWTDSHAEMPENLVYTRERIETERLVLRRLPIDDAPDVLRYFSGNHVTRYLSLPAHPMMARMSPTTWVAAIWIGVWREFPVGHHG
jgi:RimJ/RimL family protein N-acetyltransferase